MIQHIREIVNRYRYTPRPIWESDWDVCLVLDACRYDVWCEVTGHTDWAWSVGSATPEWLNNTISTASDLARVGYVTANPFSGKDSTDMTILDSDVFPVRDAGFGYIDEVWRDEWPANPDLPTVDPVDVTERGAYAYYHTDIDQVIVHYMQPHAPFRSRPEWCDGWDGVQNFGDTSATPASAKDDWLKVRDGELPRQAFWAAYRDNLEWVYREVQRWIHETSARILVTSDHGNGFGEYGVYSHPPECQLACVRRVPWHRVDGVGGDTLPSVAPPVDQVDASTTRRLEALGYA